MGRKRKKPSMKPPPWNGDHGTGTTAALAGTKLVPLEGGNPNRIARRHRVNQIDEMRDRLSMRQIQAAKAIEAAYCKVQSTTSGTDLKVSVDSSPKPDAVIAGQVDAQSHLVFVMKPVPRAMRDVVEHVCWHNLPISQMAKGRKHYNRMADFQVALDLVANRLGY